MQAFSGFKTHKAASGPLLASWATCWLTYSMIASSSDEYEEIRVVGVQTEENRSCWSDHSLMGFLTVTFGRGVWQRRVRVELSLREPRTMVRAGSCLKAARSRISRSECRLFNVVDLYGCTCIICTSLYRNHRPFVVYRHLIHLLS